MEDTYIALDLETTGLSPANDRILEIGALWIENGEVTDTYETFVDCGIPIPQAITQLTGITDEMVKGSPCTEEAVRGFLDFTQMRRERESAPARVEEICAAGQNRQGMSAAAGSPCTEVPDPFAGEYVLLGHNLPFDYSFVKYSMARLGLTYESRGLDTLKMARTCLPRLEKKSLDRVSAYLGIPQKHHHRALDDALTASRIYERLKREFGEQYPELFEPQPMACRVPKMSPITNSQKVYLRDLIKCHRIESNVKIETLTKNEASRMIDSIISQYGRLKR